MASLQNILFSTLDRYDFGDNGRPLRVFPIAYPLLETTWKLRERRITPIGLIQRHLLQALIDLGPSSPADLDAVYCLGEQEITDTFQEMLRDGAPITCQGGLWQRTEIPSHVLPDQFVCEEIHEREFLQDGLSGGPLPIDLLEKFASFRLFPSEKEPETMVDKEKLTVRVRLRLSPSFNDGVDLMRKLVEQTDRQQRLKLGMPEEAFGLDGTNSVSQKPAWLLVFVTIHQNGTVRLIHPAGVDVDLPSGITAKQLKEYLASFAAFRSKIDFGPVLPGSGNAEKKSWITEKSPGKTTVTLKHFDPPLTFADSARSDSKDASRQQLARVLARGQDWDPGSGALTTIIPADKDSAGTMLLFQCAHSLRKEIFRPSKGQKTLSSAEDVVRFLSERQQEILALFPSKVRCEPLSADEFLRNIRTFPDQEFLEELSFLTNTRKRELRPDGAMPKQAPFLANFRTHDGTERKLGEAILGALKRAKRRIDLLSPAVELFDELRQAIGDAVRRGVEIRLITELTDKAAFFPPLPTRGMPGEKQRPDHVREMTMLGVLCREPRYFCHAKMLQTESELIISSANLNSNSLGYGPSGSVEAGFRLNEPPLLRLAGSIFDDLWSSSPTRQHLQENKVNITDNPAEEIPASALVRESGDWKFILSVPRDRYTLTKELVRSIDAARDSVRLCSLSVYDTLDVPTLHKSLLAARRRNVVITILVRKDNFKEDQWPDPSTRQLIESGVSIRLVDGLHAKLLEVDQKRFSCFSGNLNPYSLSSAEPTAQVEIGVFGSDGPILQSVHRFIDQCMDSSFDIPANF